MRLINVDTYEVREFFGDGIPGYAILSHTWGSDEVTIHEIQSLQLAGNQKATKELRKSIRRKEGFQKIEYTCRQAQEDGLSWAWVDTCCIDKTSSAELSEAINSMFRWYQDSAICYAYLVDVQRSGSEEIWIARKRISESRYWTRGWTLQELIAPRRVEFYTAGWRHVGSRKTCFHIIQEVTQIPRELLLGDQPPNLMQYSVAQRLSWAAARECTRVEDTAYCLLGLFDINMPLLYGEGHKAFLRLQEEIWRDTDDHSLLAWTAHPSETWLPGSVFAPSPAAFLHSGDIVSLHEEAGNPSVVTKKGLQLSTILERIEFPSTSMQFWKLHRWRPFHASLNCGRRQDESATASAGAKRIALLVIEVDLQQSDGLRFSRCYNKINTPNHIEVPDLDCHRDPDRTQTIFLRTRQHQLISPLKYHVFPAAFVHIHGIPVRVDHSHDTQEPPNMPNTAGYVLRCPEFLTGQTRAFLRPSSESYSAKFVLPRDNMLLYLGLSDVHHSDPALHYDCTINFQLPPEKMVRVKPRTRAPPHAWSHTLWSLLEHFVEDKGEEWDMHAGVCTGHLASIALPLNRATIMVDVLCQHEWEWEFEEEGIAAVRVHMHLCMAVFMSTELTVEPRPRGDKPVSLQCWRVYDVFAAFQKHMNGPRAAY